MQLHVSGVKDATDSTQQRHHHRVHQEPRLQVRSECDRRHGRFRRQLNTVYFPNSAFLYTTLYLPPLSFPPPPPPPPPPLPLPSPLPLPVSLRYVRILGALYLRLVGTSLEVYNYLEPLLNDYRKLKLMDRNGNVRLSHVDEFIDDLLQKDRSCDIILPRIQVTQYSLLTTV